MKGGNSQQDDMNVFDEYVISGHDAGDAFIHMNP